MSSETDDLGEPFPSGAGRPTAVRYLVLVALATAAVHAYLTRACLAPAASTIQAQMQIPDPEMGLILGGFFAGYIWSQIPGGWLGARLGARASLALLCLLWSAATLATSLARSPNMLWWSRVGIGLAQGGLFPIASQVIVDWFPESRRGLASAVPTGFMSVGSITAQGLTALLLVPLGWRLVFQAYAALGIVWAIAFFAWFRNRPEEHPGTNLAERKLIACGSAGLERSTAADSSTSPASSTYEAFLSMATSLGMWAHCSQSFFRAFGYAFFITWLPQFLERRYGVKVQTAGLLSMLPLAGVVAGSLGGGLVVDAVLERTGSRWKSRSGVSAVALSLCAGATLAAAYVREPLAAVLLVSLGMLFFGLSGPTTWAVTMDIGGRHTAIVFAIMNMAGNLGAIACPVVVGRLLEFIRRTGAGWSWVYVLFTIVYLAAAASWLLLDPNRSVVERPQLREAGPEVNDP